MSEKMPDCGCGHPDRHRELYRTENLGGFGQYCRYCRGLVRQENYHHDDKYRALEAEVERLCSRLQSIANNSCCGPCQEAKLVAREALEGK